MLLSVEGIEAKKVGNEAPAESLQTVTGQRVKRKEESYKQTKGNKAPAVRKQKVTSHKAKRDKESDDSMEEAYDPTKDSDAGESSSEDSCSATKHPSTSKRLPHAKRRKLSASPSTSRSSPATNTTSPSTSTSPSGKRSHHQKKQCPVPSAQLYFPL